MNKYSNALTELSEIGFQEFVKDAGNRQLIRDAMGIAEKSRDDWKKYIRDSWNNALCRERLRRSVIDKHTDNG